MSTTTWTHDGHAGYRRGQLHLTAMGESPYGWLLQGPMIKAKVLGTASGQPFEAVLADADTHIAATMADLVRQAADALQQVHELWDGAGLPDDFATPATGYPFEIDLADQIATVYAWADQLTPADTGAQS